MSALAAGEHVATRTGHIPAVSVVMAVYNAAAYVDEAIRSIRGQRFGDFEFIIVDDGSTDGSAAIIDRHAAADGRIRVVRQANQGIVRSVNTGLSLARAPLIARMDADDVSMPWRLERQVAAMRSRPRLAAIGGHVHAIDAAGRRLATWLSPVGPRRARAVAEDHSPLVNSTAVIRRDAMERVGGYRWGFEPAEDYDLWLRLLDAGAEVDNLPLVVACYRVHDASVSVRRAAKQRLAELMARTTSRMRRAGIPDPIRADEDVELTTFERLPPAHQPCRAALWEAQHGPVAELDTATVAAAIQEVAGSVERRRCGAETARFLAKAGLALLGRGMFLQGLHAMGQAHRNDLGVVPRQFTATALRRARRWAGRVRFSAERLGRAPYRDSP